MLDEDDKDIQEQQEEEVSSPENDESEAKSSQKEASDKDTEDTDSGKKTSEDELADYSESVKKRINKLTYKAREAERRELEALEYAKAVKLELDGLRKRETTLNKSFESEAETRLSAQEQLFRDQLKFAVDSGDVDKQVEMQTSLVRLASERERLRNYRAYRQQEQEVTQTYVPPPPVRQTQPDPKAEAWGQKNVWFGKDRAMTREAMEIHNDLLQEGYSATDDDYYRELDKRIRQEFPHKFTPVKKPNNPVASARPTQVKRSSGDVELTETQKTIAKRLGVSYDDYRRQLKLVQERV